MVRAIGYKKMYEVSLALMAFLMLVVPKLVTIGIILHLGVTVYGIVKRKLEFGINPLNVLFFLLYVAYLIGVFFTDHPDIAQKYLEYKLALVVFPLLFSFKMKEEVSLKLPSIGLFAGVIVLMILGCINSTFYFLETNSYSAFLSGRFSYIHHPTYFAVFAFVGMLLIQYAKEQGWFGTKKWIYSVLLVVMIIAQILSISMAGVLMLFLYIAVMVLKWILRRFGKIPFLAVLVISPVILFLIISKAPGLKTQFETSKKFVVEYVKDPIAFIEVDQTYVQGDETRLIMWTVAALEFSEHPMGVGTGNVDERLDNRLLTYGQVDVASHDYNPHNQFLQTAVEIGWIGLLIFIGIITYVLFVGFKFKNVLITFIGINLAFNSLFESMLQRQSGIVFYVFWMCLITYVLLQSKRKANN